jgi:pimeloyl-ACP methyl ester carboxylesterase
MRRGYARTLRGDIHYAETGSGEPLLLLHANPRSHRYFRHVLPPLGERYRAIAADIPGFGESHPVPRPTTIRGLAECFVAFFDTLGVERAHVAGLHAGNKIAAALAAEWPDRVGALVLAGQTHSLIPGKQARDAAIRNIVEHYFPQYGEHADGAHRVRQWAAVHAEAQGLWWPQRLRTAARVEAADLENAEEQVLDYLKAWRSIVPVYDAIFAFDLEDALRRIRSRTLVLELQTPEEAHLGAQAEAMRSFIPGAQALAIPGDGEAFENQPHALAQALLRFLG